MKTQMLAIPALFLFLTLFFPSILSAQVPTYVPTNGLVGWWPFNGNANDESGNGNHGTVNGATLTADRNGNQNGSYYFNGLSSSITINNSFYDNGWNENSICLWFKPNSNSINSCLFNTIPHDGTALSFGLYGTNQKLYFGKNANPTQHLWNIIGGNLGNHEFAFPIFDYSEWYFISIVKNNNTYSFYVNGILDHSTVSTITPISYYCAIILGNLDPNQGFASEFYKGFMDDLAIYNRALTPEEITALYNGTTTISGCTNSTACNYNAAATQDDGSCTYPAQSYLNCAGTCINDADNDGTCDELENPTLPSYLPSNGLVGYWPFNGNANDESGNGNHGTVNGATLTADRNGNANSAYGFNGSSYIEVMDNSIIDINQNQSFSLILWIKLNNSLPEYSGLVSKMTVEGYPNAIGYQFVVGNYAATNVLATEIGQSSSTLAFNANSNLNDGTWKHIACVFNRSDATFKFIVNGVIDFETINQSIPSLNLENSANMYFGAERTLVYHFNGLLDDIAIYNRALTQEEITALYNGTTGGGGGGNGGTAGTPAPSVPQGIPYQAMIRDNNGAALVNTPVTVRFSLRQDAIDGAVEYQETQALTTNAFGLINTQFGAGTATQGTFAGINWSSTNKFIQVEANTGAGYVDMGTQQMMSVPFALQSNKATMIKNAGLPVYADNAAALAGGLVAGEMYRTATGDLKIVY